MTPVPAPRTAFAAVGVPAAATANPAAAETAVIAVAPMRITVCVSSEFVDTVGIMQMRPQFTSLSRCFVAFRSD